MGDEAESVWKMKLGKAHSEMRRYNKKGWRRLKLERKSNR